MSKQYGPYDSVRTYPNPIDRDHPTWFSKDTMRFFNSRVSEYVYGGRVFVSSERDDFHNRQEQRYYTLRIATSDGNMETIGEFQQYASRNGAHKAAERFVKQYKDELPTMTSDRVREINKQNEANS